MSITPEQLAEWERITEAATLGPWATSSRSSGVGADYSYEDDFLGWELAPLETPQRGQITRGADAQFIAEARTAMPLLLAEVRRLQDQLALVADAGDAVRNSPEALNRSDLAEREAIVRWPQTACGLASGSQ